MKNASLWAAGAVLAAAAVRYRAWPQKDPISGGDIPESYMIPGSNRIDYQGRRDCAAFSSAYVLRHLGMEADGSELYKSYPRKLLDGTVDPKGILVLFRQLGYEASFYQGDAETLKRQIGRGVPVILFIKTIPNKRHLHFVPVVGYDRENFYLAESLEHKANDDGPNHNRKLPIAELESIWRTNLLYRQSYIVVHAQDRSD
ncbi:cysteine peptidase family C39 domain-containing protein [Saccharibacillus kuerlensis]|uniref:Peptidase C39 domain-containing protein n=1 Tax=Saccharibacillus kuerlensis TaxID=459527 RepID=A0ABQ2LA53_9BACL|nr:cysteine peptidase family C39 domain-containing protein [Saccharibacillus kuerlensis]GGO08308.1 hypothetical protein GCM10010969_37640 [Saccharibacillus kuerlensis]